MVAVPKQKKKVSSKRVLVVDDEASIRRSLEGVLRDEGYEVEVAQDGEGALAAIRKSPPHVVLLDIWMPGMDGLEVLKEIRKIAPSTGVVMISGHATIATAILATRYGALDFIEKPFDLRNILAVVERVACTESPGGARAADEVSLDVQQVQLKDAPRVGTLQVNSIVFSDQKMRGRKLQQRTLARSAILYGQGLHSGKKSGLVLEPLPPNSGIHFVGISSNEPVPAYVDYVGSTGFATTVKLGATQAGTIEHLMSALHACGISNLLIKCNGEVPVMDGSAREFCDLFIETGIEDQPGDWFAIKIARPLQVGSGREYIRIEPADTFIVDYTLEYPEPVGTQHRQYSLDSLDAYRGEIAPARTFGFVRDIGALQKQGLALGGRFDNFVLIGDEGPINDALRFPDEPVRHKILDAIGDLYLLGRPIEGKVTACMTGHSDNIALLRLLREELRR